MQPTLAKQPFSNPEWLFEPKWDGFRAICYLRDGVVSFTSRRRNDLTLKFPSLQKVAGSIKAENAILDGEIVALDKDGAVRFEGLRSENTDFAIVYFAFDLLHLDGIDQTQLPLIKRKVTLKRILPRRNSGKIRYTDHVVGEGKLFFDELEKMGLEGMVAKRLDSLYVPGRTRTWLKVKTQAGRDEMQKRSEAWHGPRQ